MAVIRDVMPAFDLLQPNSIVDAQKLLQQHGADAWVMAGGLDSFDWLKDRIKKPKIVVDLSGIEELRGVRANGDGIEIGAMTTLSEVVTFSARETAFRIVGAGGGTRRVSANSQSGHARRKRLAGRALLVLPRGLAVLSRRRKYLLRRYSEGRNREHAILHADRCVAVNPSDSAPALIALDAKFVMRTPKGERIVDAEDYFIGPEIDITRLHILKPGDLLTAIRIPGTWAGAKFYFEKVRDRNVWDFPLLNVASAIVVSNGVIERMRIAVNGAAARPLRLKNVEDAVRGKPANAATGEMAGKLAVQGAIPLQFNAYKIPLMRNLVKRAIGGVEEATWAS